MIAHGHTLEHIRQRRAAGLGKRRHRIPRVVQPTAIRVGYWNAIRQAVLEPAHAAVTRTFPTLRQLAAAVSARADEDETTQASRAIARVADDFTAALRPRPIEDLARRFADRTSDFQAGQLARQTRAALGVDVPLNAPTQALLDKHVADNVALIKSIPPQYFADVQRVVADGVTNGRRWESIAGDIAERYDVADSRAKLIARDQTGKLFGALNKVRQEGMGVTGYTWRTMNDSRVRDEHAELEGETFDWSDDPPDGIPGEAVNCRCFAEPDVSALLDDLDDDTDGAAPRLGLRDVGAGELADVMFQGGEIEPTIAEEGDEVRKENIRTGLRAGNEFPPMKIAVSPAGDQEVVDGRHRIAVLREPEFSGRKLPARFVRGAR